MSGGSFNNLWCADAAELVQQKNDLLRMIDALECYPGTDAAIAQTKRVLELIREIEMTSDPVRQVWYAVELHKSGDWSAHQVNDTIETYNENTV